MCLASTLAIPYQSGHKGYCRQPAHRAADTGGKRTMSSRSATPTRDRRWRRSYLGVMGLFWGAPGGALVVGYLVLPDSISNSQCAGTLFGCSMTPQDAMVLLAVLVYPLVVAAGLLVMGVIAVGQAWRHRPRGGCDLTCHAESKAPRCPTSQPCRPGKCDASPLRAGPVLT